jgi:hypothetical protein
MILRSYIALFRASTRLNTFKGYNSQWLALNVTQALKNIGVSEMILTDDEAKFVNDLRGVNGISAKRKAFDLLIKTGKYAYEDLIAMFPTYCKE